MLCDAALVSRDRALALARCAPRRGNDARPADERAVVSLALVELLLPRAASDGVRVGRVALLVMPPLARPLRAGAADDADDATNAADDADDDARLALGDSDGGAYVTWRAQAVAVPFERALASDDAVARRCVALPLQAPVSQRSPSSRAALSRRCVGASSWRPARRRRAAQRCSSIALLVSSTSFRCCCC